MEAIMRLFLSHVKKKKMQNFLVVVVLFLAIFMFTSAVSVIKNNKDFYYSLHKELNGAHQILQFEDGLHKPEEVFRWWSKQRGVDVTNLLPYQKISKITSTSENENIDFEALMVKTPREPIKVDKLIFVNGKSAKQPAKGKVWVPTSFALSNDIKIGDEVKFNGDNTNFSLKVEAIIFDMPYCAPFAKNGRVWMNEDDFDRIFQNSYANMMSIRFDNYNENHSYWERFEKEFGTPYLEKINEYESLSSFYLFLNRLISFIMLFLSVVMILISIFTIKHIISDTIITNYKNIGIIMSLGFTAKKTIMSYVLQYFVISLMAVIPGIILSYFASRMIVLYSFSYLKSSEVMMHFKYQSIAVLVGLLVPLLISLMVILFSNKAAKIQPAQAIRYGMDEKESAKIGKMHAKRYENKYKFSGLPVTVQLALRSILKDKQSTLLTSLISIITISVLVFCTIFLLSFINMKDSISEWGFDNSDATIVAENEGELNKTELIDHFNKLPDVAIKNYNFMSYLDVTIAKNKDVDAMGFSLNIIDGSYSNIGFKNIKGRHPKNDNEISLGVNLARKYGKNIGDKVEVYIKGKKVDFIVTGIYQGISNSAYTARVIKDTVLKVIPGYNKVDAVSVNFKNNNSTESFTKHINKNFKGNLTVLSIKKLLEETKAEAMSMLLVPIFIIGFIFLLVIFILLYCMGSIKTKKYQKTYGIYKSLGLTSNKIRKSIAYNTFIVFFINMWPGILIGCVLVPKLLDVILSAYGIVNMPLSYDMLLILFIAFLGSIAATLGSYAASRVVKHTTPKVLVSE